MGVRFLNPPDLFMEEASAVSSVSGSCDHKPGRCHTQRYIRVFVTLLIITGRSSVISAFYFGVKGFDDNLMSHNQSGLPVP